MADSTEAPAFEQQKWQAEIELRRREMVLREREQQNRDVELGLKQEELARSRWTNPLTVAILAAAVAGGFNAVVAFLNGRLQRVLEEQRADQQRRLEEDRAESGRILEVIKTGDTEKAAENLGFLLKTGLIASAERVERLRGYLAERPAGAGPALPAATGRVAFEPTQALSQPEQARLERELREFIAYLDTVGFGADVDRVGIVIETETQNAWYDQERKVIVIHRSLAGEIDAPRREYSHHILLRGKEDAQIRSAAAVMLQIEHALADYFPCSFANRAGFGLVAAQVFKTGRPQLRNLDNQRRFDETPELDADRHDRSEIWGGAFWEMRTLLGQAQADRILAQVWQATPLPARAAGSSRRFIAGLLQGVAGQMPGREAAVAAIFARRGFPMPD